MEGRVGEVTLMHGESAPDKTAQYGIMRVFTPKPDAPDLTEKVRIEFMPIWDRKPGSNSYTSAHMVDGTRISFAGWDSKVASAEAQPDLSRRGTPTPGRVSAMSRCTRAWSLGWSTCDRPARPRPTRGDAHFLPDSRDRGVCDARPW
jgi:hypothetical protein